MTMMMISRRLGAVAAAPEDAEDKQP